MRSCPNRPEGPTTITGWPRTRPARLSGATWPRSRRWPSIGCWRSATSGTGGSAPPLNIRAVATSAVTEAPVRRRERLDPSVFRLNVERIREGYYSDVYFNRTVDVLHADQRHPQVLMQVFQKQHAVIGGMDEAIAIVKLCSEDFSQLRVHALYDGDEVAPWETTMTIEGDYSLFARLETVYLGVLSRRTKVATNVRRVVEVARALGDRLWGVRLDTSETMVDVSIQKLMGDFDPRGVNPQLCTLVRRALDREGFEHVKIVASGGFNVEKIQRFEREQVPVDAYGVGSAFFQGVYDFTADVVVVEGRPCAKIGRRYRPNPRLELVG